MSADDFNEVHLKGFLVVKCAQWTLYCGHMSMMPHNNATFTWRHTKKQTTRCTCDITLWDGNSRVDFASVPRIQQCVTWSGTKHVSNLRGVSWTYHSTSRWSGGRRWRLSRMYFASTGTSLHCKIAPFMPYDTRMAENSWPTALSTWCTASTSQYP